METRLADALSPQPTTERELKRSEVVSFKLSQRPLTYEMQDCIGIVTEHVASNDYKPPTLSTMHDLLSFSKVTKVDPC